MRTPLTNFCEMSTKAVAASAVAAAVAVAWFRQLGSRAVKEDDDDSVLNDYRALKAAAKGVRLPAVCVKLSTVCVDGPLFIERSFRPSTASLTSTGLTTT